MFMEFLNLIWQAITNYGERDLELERGPSVGPDGKRGPSVGPDGKRGPSVGPDGKR